MDDTNHQSPEEPTPLPPAAPAMPTPIEVPSERPEPEVLPLAACTSRSGKHRALWHTGLHVTVTGTPANQDIVIEHTYAVRCLWCGQERPEYEAGPRSRRDEW